MADPFHYCCRCNQALQAKQEPTSMVESWLDAVVKQMVDDNPTGQEASLTDRLKAAATNVPFHASNGWQYACINNTDDTLWWPGKTNAAADNTTGMKPVCWSCALAVSSMVRSGHELVIRVKVVDGAVFVVRSDGDQDPDPPRHSPPASPSNQATSAAAAAAVIQSPAIQSPPHKQQKKTEQVEYSGVEWDDGDAED